MTDYVKTEVAAGIMTLTLARPDKKNALSSAMYSALSDGLERAEKDPAIRVVVYPGRWRQLYGGQRISANSPPRPSARTRAKTRQHFIKNLGKATKPLIAAVQGDAVGVGTTMLLHCDLVFLAETARLTTPFVNLALVPRRHRAGCCRRGSATSAPTPCSRSANRSTRRRRWPVAWPTQWCPASKCAAGRMRQRKP